VIKILNENNMNKEDKRVIAVDYNYLIKTISENPKEFLSKLDKTLLKTTPEIIETGNIFKIKWNKNNLFYELSFTNIDHKQVEIKFSKSPSKIILLSFTTMIFIGYFRNGNSTFGTISNLLLLWFVIPKFFKYQSKKASIKYINIIEKEHQIKKNTRPHLSKTF